MTLSFYQLLRLLILAVLLAALFSASTAFAQGLPCGNITGPESLVSGGLSFDIVTVPVVDCEDPFNVTIDPPSIYRLEIDGVNINSGETYIQNEPISEMGIVGARANSSIESFLFRHQANDYVFIDESVPEPTQDDYRNFASTYFDTQAEAEQYLTILFEDFETGDIDQYVYDLDYEYLIDSNTGEPIIDRYSNFRAAANNFPYGRAIEYQAGVYTMVIRESYLFLVQNTLWDKVRELFIRTAHAQYIVEPNYYTITFTIADPTPELVGASSVLFLPGIQASRLYTDGFLGTENQLWEPNTNADVEKLVMTAIGDSTNDVYTKDVIDEVLLAGLGGNIYKGFLGVLDELVQDEVIQDYVPFAYDWRYSVEDVVLNGTRYENEVRSVVATVENLAEDSFSGKVTIVGHSNGGLVAKVLLSELARQGKADLVDKVVFIGTPHLGTPKAIGTVLHGYDQQALGGAVIDDSTARAVIQNMPGAYSLLPSERYLQLAAEPVITIREGTSTAPMQNAFGNSIEGVTEYKNFLNGLEGRANDFSDISNPYKTNPVMLENALDLHTELDEWEAPVGVEVFNLVGVGLKTIRAVEYRNVTERINCTGTFFGVILCDEPVNFIRPYAHFTKYGDETVTSLSAESVEGKRYFLNFDKFNRDLSNPFLSYSHADFTEVEEIQVFLKDIINSTTTDLEYLTEVRPEFNTEYEVVTIDSPVRILKVDSSGKRAGVDIQNGEKVVLKEIPGSEYIEFGGTKYLISPKNGEATTYLYGEAFGSYTLTVATLRDGENQVIDTELINATTTPTMIARYQFTEEGYTTILIDYDGNGTIDLETTLDGQVLQEQEITLEVMRAQIVALNLSKARITPLLLFVRLTEDVEKLKVHPKIKELLRNKLLVQLRDTIKQYAKKKWITQDQRDGLIDLINRLIDL